MVRRSPRAADTPPALAAAIRRFERAEAGIGSRARRHPPRGWHQRFAGGLRTNLESVPRLSATTVRRVLDDRALRVLVWWSATGVIEEAASIEVNPARPLEVIVTRLEAGKLQEDYSFLRLVLRPLPRHDARDFLLVCPTCEKPRRYLYAWRVFGSRLLLGRWECRTCAGLRYCSEGGGLLHYRRLRHLRVALALRKWREPRPSPWDPDVFNSSSPLRVGLTPNRGGQTRPDPAGRKRDRCHRPKVSWRKPDGAPRPAGETGHTADTYDPILEGISRRLGSETPAHGARSSSR